MKKMLLLGMMLLLIGGCVKIVTTDPNTGLTTTAYAVDPNVVNQTQQIGGIVYAISSGLGAFFPWATGLAGLIAGVLGAIVKYKAMLTAAQSKQAIAYNSTEALVGLLEELKKTNPETWKALKEKLKIGPEVENVIRSIRGLPPLI